MKDTPRRDSRHPPSRTLASKFELPPELSYVKGLGDERFTVGAPRLRILESCKDRRGGAEGGLRGRRRQILSGKNRATVLVRVIASRRERLEIATAVDSRGARD